MRSVIIFRHKYLFCYHYFMLSSVPAPFFQIPFRYCSYLLPIVSARYIGLFDNKSEINYILLPGLTLHGYLSKILARSWQDLGTILAKIVSRSCHGIHGCQHVVRVWKDLALAAKMLVRGSIRVRRRRRFKNNVPPSKRSAFGFFVVL